MNMPSDAMVLRLLPNGALDATFGTGGKVVTDFNNGTDTAVDVLVQPDGKVVLLAAARDGSAAGGWTSGDIALARYLPDGTLDPAFGVGGKQLTDVNRDNDLPVALLRQTDGSWVVAGSTNISVVTTTYRHLLARYTANGTLDATFGRGDGLVISLLDRAFDAVLQNTGKIVTVGKDVTVARYLAVDAPLPLTPTPVPSVTATAPASPTPMHTATAGPSATPSPSATAATSPTVPASATIPPSATVRVSATAPAPTSTRTPTNVAPTSTHTPTTSVPTRSPTTPPSATPSATLPASSTASATTLPTATVTRSPTPTVPSGSRLYLPLVHR